ncbi:MAG TPA: hypothetical protein VFQ40_03825 [Actinomycetota bacterium]|nr:hypothetical protein [Actinomycetota bacterium]
MAEPFDPLVKGSSPYVQDGSKHGRNWTGLARFLQGAFVDADKIEDGAVGSSALAKDSVQDQHVDSVSVSKLTDGIFSAIGTIVGQWVSEHLSWTADGIVLTDEAGAAVLVRLPADGSTPFLRAQLEALGLLVENDFVLRGTNNLMEQGSAIVMGGAATGVAVGNPAAAPGLAVQRDTFEFADEGLEDLARGFFYDATNTSWWVADNAESVFPTGFFTFPPNVTEYDNDSSHTFLRSFPVNGTDRLYGVCRVGTRIFVLCRRKSDKKIFLNVYSESTLAFLGQTNITDTIPGAIHGHPGLGTNGTNVFVVDLRSTGIVIFNEYSAANVPVHQAETLSSGTGNPVFDASNATQIMGFAAAESGWWVAVQSNNRTGPQAGLQRVHKWNTSGVYQQNTFFENGENLRGLTHDGTVFHTLGDEHAVTHTNWTWTTESAIYEVAYTYVDDNGTVHVGARPLGAEDFETMLSPVAKVTMPRRAKLRMSAAAVDTGVLPITHVGWYMRRGAESMDYQADVAVVDEVQTVRVIDTYTTDGSPEAPPGSNTFPAAAEGVYATFESSDGSPILRANGYARARIQSGTPTANQPVTTSTDETADWVNHAVQVAAAIDTGDLEIEAASDRLKIITAGDWQITASCQWASSGGNGVRILTAEYSTDGTNWTALTSEGLRDRRTAGGTTSGGLTNLISGIWSFAANSYLRLRVHQTDGADVNLTEWFLQMIYFGPA